MRGKRERPIRTLRILIGPGIPRERALTIHEGICWLLQEPKLLERNHCFMTIASRKAKGISPKSDPIAWLAATPKYANRYMWSRMFSRV